MVREDIVKELSELRDEKYGSFQGSLIPGIDQKTVIGVRTPQLRALAKKLAKDPDIERFLNDLPHAYFEENQLHAFVISLTRDFDKCVKQVEDFLPYVDNWATCDQLSPGVFRKNTAELIPYIKRWMASEKTYTVRFGIGMLMRYYLDELFKPEYPVMVAEIRSDEYYVNMMIAWYFATALAKQYDSVITYIEERKLDPWVHNKSIQKSVESYRISDEHKEYLKTLKIRK